MRWAALSFMITVACAGCEKTCSCVQSQPPGEEPALVIDEAGTAFVVESVDAAPSSTALKVPHIPGSALRDLRRQRDNRPFGDKKDKPDLAVPQ